MSAQITLSAAGLRPTPARAEIFTLLVSCGAPMTPAELLERRPKLDKVTIYRTLPKLVEVGLVHRVQGLDGAWRYCASGEGDGCPGGHPHFMCTRCGEMRCLSGALPFFEVPAALTIEGKQCVLYGCCPRCGQATP
ncbi:transcriptional repressor [Myxococcota bacterium]|nr:transcriptional repressor [Myxococcota bacterium]